MDPNKDPNFTAEIVKLATQSFWFRGRRKRHLQVINAFDNDIFAEFVRYW